MRATHRGSCHCGRVTFELDANLDYVMECTCSLCRRIGALWHGASDASLRITAGEDELASLPLKRFDGANWERAAKELRAERPPRAAD